MSLPERGNDLQGVWIESVSQYGCQFSTRGVWFAIEPGCGMGRQEQVVDGWRQRMVVGWQRVNVHAWRRVRTVRGQSGKGVGEAQGNRGRER